MRNADDSMATQVAASIEAEALAARQRYHLLVLVVGPTGTGKSAGLRAVSAKTEWAILNLNLRLSEQLLDLPQRRRSTMLPRLLGDALDSKGEVTLLDNIELLFAPEFEQNPLSLLQGFSRNRTLVVAWPGQVSRGKLLYAKTGHPEARQYETDQLAIIRTEQNDLDTVDAS